VDELKAETEEVFNKITKGILTLEEVQKHIKNRELFNRIAKKCKKIDLKDFTRNQIAIYLPFLLHNQASISKYFFSDFKITRNVFLTDND
jgi:hypothetical protein